jgi:hypothetical protein
VFLAAIKYRGSDQAYLVRKACEEGAVQIGRKKRRGKKKKNLQEVMPCWATTRPGGTIRT